MVSRVLVVQPREALAHAAGRRLLAAGFEPTLALDGDAALRRIAEDPPTALLVDLTLPVLDGWYVLAAVGALPAPPPVVVYGPIADEPRARRLGADAYVHDRGAVVPELQRLVRPAFAR